MNQFRDPDALLPISESFALPDAIAGRVGPTVSIFGNVFVDCNKPSRISNCARMDYGSNGNSRRGPVSLLKYGQDGFDMGADRALVPCLSFGRSIETDFVVPDGIWHPPDEDSKSGPDKVVGIAGIVRELKR